MRRPRPITRRLLLGACAAVAGTLAPAAAQERVVRLVVPAPAGGDMDSTARRIARPLGAVLHASVVVDNRPGASTNLGAEYVVRGPADGSQLLIVGASYSINPVLQKLPFDPATDLRPVIQISRNNITLAIRAGLGVASMEELAAAIRARPDRLSCGAAPGNYFLACEFVRNQFGGRTTTVPFNGVQPVLTALLGGHVDMAFLPSDVSSAQLGGSRIRVLAASGSAATRAALGGVPRLEDALPGVPYEGYFGILVPGRTADSMVAELNAALDKVLRDPTAQDLLAPGQEVVGGSAEAFGAMIRAQTAAYRRLAAALGIQTP